MSLIPHDAQKLNYNNELISNQSTHLPKQLESVVKAEAFAKERHRWNTNEEIASVLIAFDKHEEWQAREIFLRPPSGTMLLYNRKVVRYRKDGYCWKKRKDGKTTREDHMKLKVQGSECIYGCYVHSSILPTFHRRCYWLLQNPDVVLVHYLNVPLSRTNKLCCLPPISFECEGWAKEELESQIRPMFASLKHFSEDLTESSVQSLMNILSTKNFGYSNKSTCVSFDSQSVLSSLSRSEAKSLQKQPSPIMPLLLENRHIDTFGLNDDWSCLLDSSKGELPIEDCLNSDCSEKIEDISIALNPFLSEKNLVQPLEDTNLFSLPPCFNEVESDVSQVKMQAGYRPACDRIGQEVETDVMDDLDDILNIVSANLNESLHHSSNKLYSRPTSAEFSPEWSYSKGGEKMLITGDFDSCIEYSVHFGEVQVCAEVIQSGVLKCIIPAHNEGSVSLKVFRGDILIALCGIFVYKSAQRTMFDIQASELEGMLLSRLHHLKGQLFVEHDMKILDLLMKLALGIFPHSTYDKCSNNTHLSLLHLASAIGNPQMITLLLQIRNEENIGIIIKSEVDPLCEDTDGNIPITWACARGNLEAFMMLFQVCPYSMSFSNNDGHSPTHFIQQIGKSFYELSLPPILPTSVIKGKDKETQTTNIFGVPGIAQESRTGLDYKWPTDSDPCLPYRRSIHGHCAPTLFGASKAKEYFKEQCKIEMQTIKRTSLELGQIPFANTKLHNRSESLNEEILEFWSKSKRNFRSSSSEPQLNDPVPLAVTAATSQMGDIMSNATDFSIFPGLNMEVVEDDWIDSDHMAALASQIIAAIPERIKSHSQRHFPERELEEHQVICLYNQLGFSLPSLDKFGNAGDSGIGTPMEGIPSLHEYRNGTTLTTNLSPTSTCVTSPHHLDSPTTAADFTEYFNAPATYMEEDFSLLTLSDEEQRKVYEAARIIQNFYRRYKDEKSSRKQKEVDAAVIIQNCYRKYKQFLYYKRMNQAAVLIQSRFRSYYAQKRFRRSKEAAKIIQNRYRAYKEYEKFKRSKNVGVATQQRFRGHYQSTNTNKPPLASSVHKMLEENSGFSQKGPSTLGSDKSLNSVKGTNEAS